MMTTVPSVRVSVCRTAAAVATGVAATTPAKTRVAARVKKRRVRELRKAWGAWTVIGLG
jgi:hypothetical protein